MAKNKTVYVCANCGFESLRWVGKCPSCEAWDTFSEEIKSSAKSKSPSGSNTALFQDIISITEETGERFDTGSEELNRVLGGGLMNGSVVLIGGDPGIGKSTLVLQTAAKLNRKVLYVTGEESLWQIKSRAVRLNALNSSLMILAETDLPTILDAAGSSGAEIVIIDSIQTVSSPEFDNPAGTVTQIRECTAAVMNYSKKNNISFILIGHVTKEGFLAGPKVLEHIVDTVLYFEGDSGEGLRMLRAQKNRFGSTNELGIFEMTSGGLQEVKDAASVFLTHRNEKISGSVISATMEGSRTFLFEVQALVTPSYYGNPQRVATGFDYKRLSILLAVLEKRGSMRLSDKNVFLNMSGGIRINEPAIDLAVCCAIVGALSDKTISPDLVITGEVGLGGEIRGISNIEKRIREAEKLGFTGIIIPAANKSRIPKECRIEVIPASNLRLVFENLF